MGNCSLGNFYVQLVAGASDVGQFLKLRKSQNNGVDSTGHPFKERLMSIVGHVVVTNSNPIGYVTFHFCCKKFLKYFHVLFGRSSVFIMVWCLKNEFSKYILEEHKKFVLKPSLKL